MKRTAIKPGTKGLARTTRIKPKSDRRAEAVPVEAVIREQVFARDRYCQVYARAYTVYDVGPCSGPLTPHHRRKASDQGAYSLENLVAVCAGHNTAMEHDAGVARWARSEGLVVRRGDAEWEGLGRVRK